MYWDPNWALFLSYLPVHLFLSPPFFSINTFSFVFV
uniref:Uncharacterized protein n=1 Tax=Arundo donax TaxID=35708 RepID=A0A0A8ZCN3_ARUDO